jgi:SWI/SNF-related matrix-associated actin-dependent regulator of chromatin subfamily A3
MADNMKAHCIHNRKTIAARAVCAIKSTYKWAVTGTPILNKLQDLGSIFEFLGVYPFSDAKVFNSEIVQPLLHGDAKELTKLRCLVTAISLHRTKSIIDLPNRQDEVHHLDFTLAERRVYDAAMERAAVLFDGQFTKSGPVKSAQYLHGLQFLNQLRLLCNNGQWEPATAKLSMMSEILGREESITWNSGTAQKTFIRLLNAGAATCSNCDEDLMSRAITGNYDPQYRLSKCLMLVCDDCLLNIPKASKDGICSHHPPCPSHWVSINDRDPSPELASVNERRDFDLAKIPTKVSALISNLNEARGQKRYGVIDLTTRRSSYT